MENPPKISMTHQKQLTRSVAFIGNHLPRRCGIATFTSHLLDAISAESPRSDCEAVAINDNQGPYHYPNRVKCEIEQHSFKDYIAVANKLNAIKPDIVCLQHEFGIFGGNRGSFILELLQHLQVPVVTTLHTILKEPTKDEYNILKKISQLSDRLVVMSQSSIEILCDVFKVDPNKIVLIPHGIPDIAFTESRAYKSRFNLVNKRVLLTFGLLSPGKGIETVINALPEVVKQNPDVVYLLVGATHPHIKSVQGESYRIKLQQLAIKLGVEKHIIFQDSFVSEKELSQYIGAADIYITPYVNEKQIISGTLAYALGMGKAVVSTPYWHALEMLGNGLGRLFPFNDHLKLAAEVNTLLGDPELLKTIQKKAYQVGRRMTWGCVAKHYVETFNDVIRSRFRQVSPVTRLESRALQHQPLPNINTDHLIRMSDGVGILQHCKFSVPNRDHGYCIDDNARALIVTVNAINRGLPVASLEHLMYTYLSFLEHAFNPESQRFRNLLSYERVWLEEQGSEDSHGRALWSLALVAAEGKIEAQVNHALDLFYKALNVTRTFDSPRAVAFTLIGLNSIISKFGLNDELKNIGSKLAARLHRWFAEHSNEDWPWCEETLTYDNARLPQALILSSQWLNNKTMLDTALVTLNWLKKIQLDPTGCFFSAIGNKGWYNRNSNKASFDQQPIEAAAMIDASIEAYTITQDNVWSDCAYRCFNWFQGDNDLKMQLVDDSTGGCRDGLGEQGANQNQGAESTLCWLHSLLAVYKLRGIMPSNEFNEYAINPVQSTESESR